MRTCHKAKFLIRVSNFHNFKERIDVENQQFKIGIRSNKDSIFLKMDW